MVSRLESAAERYRAATERRDEARAVLHREIRAARRRGRSLRQIAAATGLSHTAVAEITR